MTFQRSVLTNVKTQQKGVGTCCPCRCAEENVCQHPSGLCKHTCSDESWHFQGCYSTYGEEGAGTAQTFSGTNQLYSILSPFLSNCTQSSNLSFNYNNSVTDTNSVNSLKTPTKICTRNHS